MTLGDQNYLNYESGHHIHEGGEGGRLQLMNVILRAMDEIII